MVEYGGETRERFLRSAKYAVYYGVSGVEPLMAYDTVIVEPAGQSRHNVELMQKQGTVVLAYVSVMELPPRHSSFAYVKPEDFIQDKGKPVMNEAFGNHLMDLHSKRWLGLLRHQIGTLITRDRYDGIFLDTIGDVEFPYLSVAEQERQLEGAVQFVESLRALFPEKVIVQNNGLEKLCLRTGPWIDGICWENPPLGRSGSHEWCEAVLERLRFLKTKWQVQTLLLYENQRFQNKETIEAVNRLVRKDGFLLYVSPTDYLSLPYEE